MKCPKFPIEFINKKNACHRIKKSKILILKIPQRFIKILEEKYKHYKINFEMGKRDLRFKISYILNKIKQAV